MLAIEPQLWSSKQEIPSSVHSFWGMKFGVLKFHDRRSDWKAPQNRWKVSPRNWMTTRLKMILWFLWMKVTPFQSGHFWYLFLKFLGCSVNNSYFFTGHLYPNARFKAIEVKIKSFISEDDWSLLTMILIHIIWGWFKNNIFQNKNTTVKNKSSSFGSKLRGFFREPVFGGRIASPRKGIVPQTFPRGNGEFGEWHWIPIFYRCKNQKHPLKLRGSMDVVQTRKDETLPVFPADCFQVP